MEWGNELQVLGAALTGLGVLLFTAGYYWTDYVLLFFGSVVTIGSVFATAIATPSPFS